MCMYAYAGMIGLPARPPTKSHRAANFCQAAEAALKSAFKVCKPLLRFGRKSESNCDRAGKHQEINKLRPEKIKLEVQEARRGKNAETNDNPSRGRSRNICSNANARKDPGEQEINEFAHKKPDEHNEGGGDRGREKRGNHLNKHAHSLEL